MTLVMISSGVLGVMLAVALWNVCTAPRLGRFAGSRSSRRVSLLIPARNEADNLRDALPALLSLEGPGLEILVLDDESTDATAAVVEEFSARAPDRLRLLRGRALPAGWVGKNWACHQLAEAASGDVLVFCDADVTVRPDALSRTLGAMEWYGADVLSALPRQRLTGVAVAAVVPLVAQLPVLALLPLSLVPRTRSASISMANGQWLAFTRDAYRACGGHAAARSKVLEDVWLGRRAKASGQRLVVALATEELEVRMYENLASLRAGFAKNLYALAGGGPLTFGVAVAVFVVAAIVPWVVVFSGALLPLALLIALRLCGAALFRHGLRPVLLHPLGSLLLLGIAVESAVVARAGVRWKGREVAPARATPTSP